MRAAARGMEALGVGADLVLTSPLIRCRQTAEIVCERLGGEPREDPRLEPGMGLDELDEALAEHPDAGAVLVVGHQPDLSDVVADLTGGGFVEFRKGSLALLEVGAVRPAGGRLRALYPPAALRALGGVGP
jgi:phosphohistidine phosphatase